MCKSIQCKWLSVERTNGRITIEKSAILYLINNLHARITEN